MIKNTYWSDVHSKMQQHEVKSVTFNRQSKFQKTQEFNQKHLSLQQKKGGSK